MLPLKLLKIELRFEITLIFFKSIKNLLRYCSEKLTLNSSCTNPSHFCIKRELQGQDGIGLCKLISAHFSGHLHTIWEMIFGRIEEGALVHLKPSSESGWWDLAHWISLEKLYNLVLLKVKFGSLDFRSIWNLFFIQKSQNSNMPKISKINQNLTFKKNKLNNFSSQIQWARSRVSISTRFHANWL